MQIEVPNGIIQDVETNRLNIEINALAIFKNAEEIAIAPFMCKNFQVSKMLPRFP